jgi:hypothetical protein
MDQYLKLAVQAQEKINDLMLILGYHHGSKSRKEVNDLMLITDYHQGSMS